MTLSYGPWVPGTSRFQANSLALSALLTAECPRNSPGERGGGGSSECVGGGTGDDGSSEGEPVTALLPFQLPLGFG